ncbi:protein bcp1 [Sphaerosporella brunnea]|uniref:Protein BCP1 n=1 Tax=Sphaerosporella brunnea TaxID=1250544 RepID=A0A5J5F0P5_9PEZI|nr:protein bcp1 [Sphaerosporella brunnea]
MPSNKRKDPINDDGNGEITMSSAADSGDDSGSEDMDLVNVDFEMFDPQPAHDFHGIRQLLRQLFDADSALFDLSALTDLILSQPLLGTTVKTEGNESDPFAFLTVINLHEHASNPAIQTLASYLLAKSASNPQLHAKLRSILDSGSSAQVGLILTERLINMPVQVVPPMYKMLLEEIEWALAENEPYNFTHFMVLSKTYTEVASRLDELEARPNKKGKKQAKRRNDTFYYHLEDEVIRRRCGEDNAAGFRFEKEGEAADSKRAFSDMGIKPQGLMMLVEKEGFGHMVEDLEGLFKP